ncbi:hypothetical protein L596_001988 [Steinernema carpocapsae]|uniref:C6 domain-containing protein n=1 Tax=Steinernema carpocapsae TaxID=34508 RepID=A0A4U8URS6_STECR|nr:hypothetical protein L596_001988 [Steinernema carpocapsae]
MNRSFLFSLVVSGFYVLVCSACMATQNSDPPITQFDDNAPAAPAAAGSAAGAASPQNALQAPSLTANDPSQKTAASMTTTAAATTAQSNMRVASFSSQNAAPARLQAFNDPPPFFPRPAPLVKNPAIESVRTALKDNSSLTTSTAKPSQTSGIRELTSVSSTSSHPLIPSTTVPQGTSSAVLFSATSTTLSSNSFKTSSSTTPVSTSLPTSLTSTTSSTAISLTKLPPTMSIRTTLKPMFLIASVRTRQPSHTTMRDDGNDGDERYKNIGTIFSSNSTAALTSPPDPDVGRTAKITNPFTIFNVGCTSCQRKNLILARSRSGNDIEPEFMWAALDRTGCYTESFRCSTQNKRGVVVILNDLFRSANTGEATVPIHLTCNSRGRWTLLAAAVKQIEVHRIACLSM